MSSTTVRPASAASEQREWWILVDGRPEGPYSKAFVRVTLERADAPGDMQICPVGETEWRSARKWSDFAELAQAPSATFREPGPPLSVDHKLILRVIGFYAAIVAPLLLLLQIAATFTGNSLVSELTTNSVLLPYGIALDLFWSVVDAGTTAFLCLAGWWLLSSKRKGVATSLFALGSRTVCVLVQIPIVILWSGLVDLQASQPQIEPPMGAWLVSCTLLFLAGLLFELVALVWLLLNRDRLRNTKVTGEGGGR